MNASPQRNLGLINGIPANELLEGLGNLHQSVAVMNTRGVVLWASRALERALGGRGQSTGLPLATLLGRYLEAENETSLGAAGASAGRSPAGLGALAAEVRKILEQLVERDSLCHHKIAPGACEGHYSSDLEINVFRVDSRATQGEASGSPQTERLYVTILRPVPKSQLGDETHADLGTFYRSVLDQSPEATLTIDQSGFITYANARTVALLGKTPGELIDAPVSLYFPSSAILPVRPPQHPEPQPGERRLVELAPSGGRPAIFIEVTSRKLELPDGKHAGHILQLRDTTRQRHATQQLEQKIASLESYVHTVSHDLRSPLVSLLGFTRLLKQDYGRTLDDTGRRFLDHIEQAASNMNTMTEDLLELSTRERPLATPDAVDPRNVLLQIKAELKPRLDEQRVHLELPASPPMIACGRTQLYQIFANLIGNALQHMGPCSDPRIEVEFYESAGQQILVVRDNGQGIAAEAHEQIFDAFLSLSRDDGAQSTGVGLAIVKKIALAHEGRVWVESAPQRGAAFFVSLKRR